MKHPLHPFCTAFRRASPHELDEIVASMKTTGYDREQPITLYDNAVLDGGTRQEAAELAGVVPTFTTFTGTNDEAMALVIRRNKARKHMTMGELDLALARLVTARQGHQPGTPSRNKKPNDYTASRLGSTATKTAGEAAKEAGRSRGSVMKARELLNHAAPNIIAMVETGELGTSTAADGVRGRSKEEQTTMTAADVRRSNRERDKRDHAYVAPLREPKPKPEKKEPKAAPKIASGGFTKLDIGEERIPFQPVHLWPVHVQRLMEASIRVVAGTAGPIKACTTVDAKQFLADIEQMLAYQPVKGKTNGEEKNYAKEARETLQAIDQNIEKAIERLFDLHQALATIKAKM